jgi:hypothetical protein
VRLTFDDYILDVARRELWRGSEPIVVEPQVFDLLVYLVQQLCSLPADRLAILPMIRSCAVEAGDRLIIA